MPVSFCAAPKFPPVQASVHDRSMKAWALRLEYDGTSFVGWQRQDNGISVQQVLERAAAILCGGPVPAVHAAGRTDAGVHAAWQAILIELPERYSAVQVREALNFHMKPQPVVVLDAVPAPAGWHPRFSAIGRTYRYLILNRPARPVLAAHRVWHLKKTLDVAAMHRAAQSLLGRHDFSSFRASACQARSPVRTLDVLNVSRNGEMVVIDAAARSFLHHQVRNIVGTLKLVGDGSWRETRVAEALAARDRSAAGPTAPPDGLTLTGVAYEPDPFASLI
jgi:tRNA pseudouridine38-40 synthase